MPDIQRLISGSTLRIRMAEPFFATLLLFARIKPQDQIETAATNGRDIYINPEFASKLTVPQLDGVLLHEVLHCALLHTVRRGSRIPKLWNYAADIVVNGQIRQLDRFELPEDAIVAPKLEEFSTEEVYALLIKEGLDPETVELRLDLLDAASSVSDGMAARQDAAELETHWRVARNQATLVAKMQKSGKGQGWGSGNWNREYAVVDESILDWRQYLWRFIVRTPTDFTGFDRRFIGEGLYLDGFSGETVSVIICIDTSGSISDHELGQFRAEVLSILRCYPHIQAELFYADTELHGPYSLKMSNEWPTPVGGGGTDFRPFFDYLVENEATMLQQRAAVYLTDGYGSFPDYEPKDNVLWVVTAGGLGVNEFPFGEVAQLV